MALTSVLVIYCIIALILLITAYLIFRMAFLYNETNLLSYLFPAYRENLQTQFEIDMLVLFFTLSAYILFSLFIIYQAKRTKGWLSIYLWVLGSMILIENVAKLSINFIYYLRISNIHDASSYFVFLSVTSTLVFFAIIVVLYKFPQPNVYFIKFRQIFLGLRLLMVIFNIILNPVLDIFITASTGNPTQSNPLILSLVANRGVDVIVLLGHIPILYYFGKAIITHREGVQISTDDVLYRENPKYIEKNGSDD